MNLSSRNYSALAPVIVFFLSCYSYSPVIVKYRIPVPGSETAGEKARYIVMKSKKYLAEITGGAIMGKVNNSGVDLALKGRFSEAEVLFRDVILEMPDDPAAYNNLGVIYELFGLREKAFDMYSKACIKEPDNDYFRHNFLTFADSGKR